MKPPSTGTTPVSSIGLRWMRARLSVSSMSGIAAQNVSSVMTIVRASTAWARTPAWTSAAVMSSHESRSPIAATASSVRGVSSSSE